VQNLAPGCFYPEPISLKAPQQAQAKELRKGRRDKKKGCGSAADDLTAEAEMGVVQPRLRTAALMSGVRMLHQLLLGQALTKHPAPGPAEEGGDASSPCLGWRCECGGFQPPQHIGI